MMIGSHNSLTYLPVKQWYFKPLKWTAKCQSKTIHEQYYDYGVRLFDFRVRFDKNMDPVIAHGPIEFKGGITCYLYWLDKYANSDNATIYVRILLESNKPMKNQDEQDLAFTEFCEYITHKYPNIIFIGGQRKYDWKEVYRFKHTEPEIIDKYSSTTNIFGGSKDRWTAKLDDLWPWLYAKLYNKRNKKRYIGIDNNILFIDYVNI